MLVVKALELMQRRALAKAPENGAIGFTTAATAVAIVGALTLFVLAQHQVEATPDFSNFSSEPSPDAFEDSTSQYGDAAGEVGDAAADAMEAEIEAMARKAEAAAEEQ